MRKILFKAKRLDRLNIGKWVEGSFIQMDDSASQSFIFPLYELASTLSCAELTRLNMVPVDPSTVCQFTGLTDKNGKEIFEGDIVCDETGGVGVVDYSDGAYVIEYEKPIMPEWTGTLLFAEEPKEIVIIGSIHDAPIESEGSK